MSTRLENFISSIKNLAIGLWNNFGIIGKLLAILLSPSGFILILSLFVLKYGFWLLGVLIDEVHFEFKIWAEATAKISELLEEFLKHKIWSNMLYLWEKLFDNNATKTSINLSANWGKNLLLNSIKQFHFIIGLTIILLSISSFFYTALVWFDIYEFKLFFAWLFRLLLLTPILHRIVRYWITKQPISWTSIFDVEKFKITSIKSSKFMYAFVGIFICFIIPFFIYTQQNTELFNTFYTKVVAYFSANETKEKDTLNLVEPKQPPKASENVVQQNEKPQTLRDSIHIVVTGEGLNQIARQYNMTTDSLAKINHINKICLGYERKLSCTNRKRRHEHNERCYSQGSCNKKDYQSLRVGQKLKLF